MSLFALISALLLEYFQPLSMRKHLSGILSGYADFFRHHFNAGEYSNGKLAWFLAVMPLVIVLVMLFHWLNNSHPVFSWLLNVLVLYFSMSFGQFSQTFDEILQALRGGRLGEARDILSKWRGASCHELNRAEVARLAIEDILLAAHQHLFGVLVWFGLFSLLGLGGAAGVMLYCLALGLSTHWADDNAAVETREDEISVEKFECFAQTVAYLLEWLPIRLSAASFAIVGNFEDAVYCWRTQASNWPDGETGILLASAAGAMGVKLGLPVPQNSEMLHRPELGMGGKVDENAMKNTSRLIWRTTIVWLLVMLLLTLAGLLG